MENKFEFGIDWNIHENLKAFKNGEQNIYKTSKNIKDLFKNKQDLDKFERIRNFEANKEIERIRLEKDI